ncbi:MAG TPA: hypothetical protein VEK73_11220 [Xanthobacteraceae bacterium]|nr:hypothetical protein [Xanthobacteraceae bacterium]
MTAARRRPRGFYARLARARGVPFHAVYLALNPDKRAHARAQHECDASLPWSRVELIRMDRAFCDAVRREIACGTERARAPAPKPVAARPVRRCRATPRRAGSSSAAVPRGASSKQDGTW